MDKEGGSGGTPEKSKPINPAELKGLMQQAQKMGVATQSAPALAKRKIE